MVTRLNALLLSFLFITFIGLVTYLDDVQQEGYAKIPNGHGFLGFDLGDDRNSFRVGVNTLKSTEEINQGYYQKLIDDTFADIPVKLTIHFKEQHRTDFDESLNN